MVDGRQHEALLQAVESPDPNNLAFVVNRNRLVESRPQIRRHQRVEVMHFVVAIKESAPAAATLRGRG